MEAALILETTFLIDLERELVRSAVGPAQGFLESHARKRLCVNHTIAGELAAGTSLSHRRRWEDFLAGLQVLPCTMEVAWKYGQIYRYLRDNGLLIGTNDLWIAATALAYDLPIVTRNRRHFLRVPGLAVADYAS